MDSEKQKFWVHPTGARPTEVTKKYALTGLSIISSTLEINKAWLTPSHYELARIQIADTPFQSDSDTAVLHIRRNEPELRSKLDAAMQLANILNRQQGIYNGLVLNIPGPQGHCALVVNKRGREQLEMSLNQPLPTHILHA